MGNVNDKINKLHLQNLIIFLNFSQLEHFFKIAKSVLTG